MRRATFLASVRADLIAIQTYITEQSGSISIGESFVRRLRAHCHKLASFGTTVGRPRPDLRADIRSAPYGSYVIFFRYTPGRFEVVNIIERHKDIDGYFDERNDP